MKLADKRKVIEVLLCALSSSGHGVSVFHARYDLGYAERFAWKALEHRRAASNGLRCKPVQHYSISCGEAAYRLIESSPTLRREWFGAP